MRNPILSTLAIACLALNALPAKPTKWSYGQTDGFKVYTNASPDKTRKIVKSFRESKHTLGKILPQLAPEHSFPLRIVICRGNRSISHFAPLYNGKPINVAGFFTSDWEGPIIVIRSDFENAATSQLINHEYIHYLTRNSGYAPPTWFSEGIAELFSTIEIAKDKRIFVGQPPTLAAEYLSQLGLMPLERMLAVNHNSPEYKSSKHGVGIFYAQSWALLHYLMFGQNDLPETGKRKLLDHAFANRHIDEPFLEATIGRDFDELQRELKAYCRKGKFVTHIYSFETETIDDTLPLRPIEKAELHLLTGMLTLATRTPQDAYASLKKASTAMPQNPTAAAYLAYHHFSQTQIDSAIAEFERAHSAGNASPYTSLHYAKALLIERLGDISWRPGSLSQEETVEILSLLFKAKREAGSFDPKLYEAIAEAWLSSVVKPEDKHISVLIEGLHLYPANRKLGLYLATHYARSDQIRKARELVNHFYPGPMRQEIRDGYSSLDKWLREKEASL